MTRSAWITVALLVSGFGLAFLFGPSLGRGPAPASRSGAAPRFEPAWTFRTEGFHVDRGALWRGVAERSDGTGGQLRAHLEISRLRAGGPIPSPGSLPETTLRSPGGRVVLRHDGGTSVRLRMPRPDDGVLLRATLYDLPAGDPVVVERVVGAAIGLLDDLASARVVLHEQNALAGFPVIRASVDGGAFVDLATAPKKGRALALVLPARPGQEVTLRVEAKAVHHVVTSRGYEEAPAAEFDVPDTGARIRDDFVPFDERGVAAFAPIRLDGPRAIPINLELGPAAPSTVLVILCLRWGRPEEAWLPDNRFPLAPPPSDPAEEQLLRTLLTDLECHYDPDVGRFVAHRGTPYGGPWSEALAFALDDLDLGAFPRLAEWRGRMAAAAGPPVEVRPQEAENLVGWIEKLGVWDQLWRVERLARLAETRPDLRERISLPRILDAVLAGLAAVPDPPDPPSRGTPIFDHGLSDRLAAIRALEAGCRVAGGAKYAAALDRQVERLRGRLESLGWLAAIRGREGRPGDARLPGLAHAVVIYARAMATVGDEAGVAEARAWVRAALLREGGEETGPFLHYREAWFADRLGFLAVLRGRGARLGGGD